ncbi:transcriptional activator domain-containing protein [Nonomuraea solani]|uniref:Transcriptional activator domain-containing protein n=1 Tax=Nonomuraea solani TaxID=1144553 RepID=A0A1H6F0P4_9ACTN|nr:BTAD domain-containing putative transcriptional regulator [Nonomuraea solani]SEH03710.1 transcriptional activator domain-containing protein [Nonomuraea solani]
MRMELPGPVRACADDGTPIEVGGVMVRALPARLALGEAEVVERAADGYRLHVRAEDVDACRFEEKAKRGGRELAAGDVRPAASLPDEALALWRGDALAGLPESSRLVTVVGPGGVGKTRLAVEAVSRHRSISEAGPGWSSWPR